jgi:putative addiction module component (TIGR02574 family)
VLCLSISSAEDLFAHGDSATFLGRLVGEPTVSFAGKAMEMSMETTSVFDLTPSEKLQLVEDLWDDLAATPEAVPVHDWQLQELDRRKARLTANPASGVSWEEVKRRVRSRYGR